jgi:RNA polymerase sigma-70 factor (ECF subfamily)
LCRCRIERRESKLSFRIVPNPADEKDRVLAALRGEPLAKAWLVEQFGPISLSYAQRMMGNENDAREMAQEAMVKVLQNLHRYDDQWRFATWVLGITRNTCIDEFRRRKRRPLMEEREQVCEDPDPAELSHERLRGAQVRAAMNELPEIYREIIVLYHYENMLYREIADLLGLPLGTVMNRLFRARRKLKDLLEARDSSELAEARAASGAW